jgi:hypothetical protein
MVHAPNNDPRPEPIPRLRRLLIIVGLLAVPVLLAVSLLYYYFIDWNAARRDGRAQDSGGYLKAYQMFLENMDADRVEVAYRSTTAAFRRRIDQGTFHERARRYQEFKKKPDTRGSESGASGPVGGDYGGPNRMVFTSTLEDGAGNQLRMSITVAQEDSIFNRRPPSPQVSEFKVETVSAPAHGQR